MSSDHQVVAGGFYLYLEKDSQRGKVLHGRCTQENSNFVSTSIINSRH